MYDDFILDINKTAVITINWFISGFLPSLSLCLLLSLLLSPTQSYSQIRVLCSGCHGSHFNASFCVLFLVVFIRIISETQHGIFSQRSLVTQRKPISVFYNSRFDVFLQIANPLNCNSYWRTRSCSWITYIHDFSLKSNQQMSVGFQPSPNET